MAPLLILIFLVSFASVYAIPIDNGVEGEPEIECAADSMTVNFNVRNDFNGHVYVKGRFAEAGECRTDGGGGGRRVAGIKLPFTACGTKRERSLTPKGIFVSNTVVISFHPQFLTKVDRAYTVQCFYMEADKTVSQDIEVSEITTALQTAAAAMPVCRYDILEGGPSGQPVKFAIIGQMVYHKWTCETETVDMFCALIHSCTVDDGAGNNVQLLNDQGCALDKHLLGNLEYQTDLMAGHEAHVFKYADKPALFFNCQISILGKEPGQPCQRPQCPEPGGPGGASASNQGGTAPPRGSLAPRGTTPRLPGTPPPPRGTFPTGLPPRTPAPGTVAPAPPAPIANPANTRVRDANPVQAFNVPIPAALRGQNGNKVVQKGGRTLRFRYARAVEETAPQVQSDVYGTWDVAAQPLTALELNLDDTNNISPFLKSLQRQTPDQSIVLNRAMDTAGGQYCLQPVAFSVMMSLSAISVVLGTVVIIFTCIRIRRRENKFF